MKKSLVYELKRLFLPLCIFTAIASVLFVVTVLTTEFSGNTIRYSPNYGKYAETSFVFLPGTILCILCYIVASMQFSYRMNRRSTDLWYALPIKRNTLMFVRLIGGLALILIPYTVSYWLGFIAIACSQSLLDIVWYIPLYFVSLPAAICLFGFNSFCFTRANTVCDGIIFIFALNLALLMPCLYMDSNFYRYTPYFIRNALNYFPFGPISYLFNGFDNLILNRSSTFDMDANKLFCFILIFIESAAAYFGLFYTANKHKAENAGQISDSFFGYKTLIPWSVFFLILTIDPSQPDSIAYLITILIYSLVAYFIYRRSFRLKKYDILSIIITFLAGIAVLALHEYVILPLLS